MVPKLVWVVTQAKAAIMSYYAQYCAVIAHKTEQHCGFGSALLPEELHIALGIIYPHSGNLCTSWKYAIFPQRFKLA